ncbi:hypothetical protein ABZV77_40925 [Streptomyces sp. NPDC004732]|uniref:hypothetical protein n=1 Tax=Streptomyces sp. NPDC004732 TaxID=3154290 RepID=UPI0033A92546
MNTGLKITAFAAAVAATFGTAYGVGTGIDPVTDRDKNEDSMARHTPEPAKKAPGGLQISDGGYTLNLASTRIEADKKQQLRFTVVEDATGRNVTSYAKEHDKELHLIVASRDLTTYRHLHPTRAADGTWSTPVRLPEAGGYRVFADFRPERAKEGLTLGADLGVAGAYEPKVLPAHSTTAKVDGYDVTLKGELKTGAGGDLTLSVAKNGRPVTDLQPYLGAYGHLVALRSGDLAYLHVHPNGTPGDSRTKAGPGISFGTAAPSKGAYRLFLDFKHEGKVRTAAFTVHAGGAAQPEKSAEPEQPAKPEQDGGGHQH